MHCVTSGTTSNKAIQLLPGSLFTGTWTLEVLIPHVRRPRVPQRTTSRKMPKEPSTSLLLLSLSSINQKTCEWAFRWLQSIAFKPPQGTPNKREKSCPHWALPQLLIHEQNKWCHFKPLTFQLVSYTALENQNIGLPLSSSNIGQYNDKILSKVNKVTFSKKVVKLLQAEKF